MPRKTTKTKSPKSKKLSKSEETEEINFQNDFDVIFKLSDEELEDLGRSFKNSFSRNDDY